MNVVSIHKTDQKVFTIFNFFFFTKLLKCAWKKKYITAWFSYAKSILTIPLSKAVLPDFYLIGFLKQSPIKNCCNLVTSRSWSHLDRTSQGLVSTKSGTRGLFCAGKVQISNCLNISFMSVIETFNVSLFFKFIKRFQYFLPRFLVSSASAFTQKCLVLTQLVFLWTHGFVLKVGLNDQFLNVAREIGWVTKKTI